MDYSHYKYILVEREGKILRLTLNRPELLNAKCPERNPVLATFWVYVTRDL